MIATLRELWGFLRLRKKLWLAPVILMILIIGLLVVAAQTSPLGPFLYTIF
jgi:uncharacterized membrane protein YjdF